MDCRKFHMTRDVSLLSLQAAVNASDAEIVHSTVHA